MSDETGMLNPNATPKEVMADFLGAYTIHLNGGEIFTQSPELQAIYDGYKKAVLDKFESVFSRLQAELAKSQARIIEIERDRQAVIDQRKGLEEELTKSQERVKYLQKEKPDWEEWIKLNKQHGEKIESLTAALRCALEHLGNMISYTKHDLKSVVPNPNSKYHIEKQSAIDFYKAEIDRIEEA